MSKTMIHLHEYPELAGKRLRPYTFRLLVKPLEAKEGIETASGIMIYKGDHTRDKEQAAMNYGVVLSVGPDVYLDRNEEPPKVGDIVNYYSYTGAVVQCPQEGEVWILNDTDVLGVYEDCNG